MSSRTNMLYDPVSTDDPPPSYNGGPSNSKPDNEHMPPSNTTHPLIRRLNILRNIYLFALSTLIAAGIITILFLTHLALASEWLTQGDKIIDVALLVLATAAGLFCIRYALRPLHSICRLKRRVARGVRDEEAGVGDPQGWRVLEDDVDEMIWKGWCLAA